jgi:hypothetical protein
LQPLAGKFFELDGEIDSIDAVDVQIRVQVRFTGDLRLIQVEHFVQYLD